MRRILAVFAHPDDEGAIAGTLTRYARQGSRVALVSVTRGEAGEISDPALASPENLGAVREQELRCACRQIGIEALHFLGYCDSGMEGTPDNQRPTAFIQANADEVVGRLVGVIRRIKPDIVITFDESGWYGHPDHVATGRYTTQAYRLAGRADAFPQAGWPWQPARLFHALLPLSTFRPLVNYARQHDIDLGQMGELNLDERDEVLEKVTHVVDARAFFDVRRQVWACHRTQFGDDHFFNRLPADVMADAMAQEYFTQVEPPIRPPASPHRELLAGLP